MSTAKRFTPKIIPATADPKKKPEPKKAEVIAVDEPVIISKAKQVELVTKEKKEAKKKSKSRTSLHKKASHNKELQKPRDKGSQGGAPEYDREKVIQKLNEAFAIGCTDLEACNYAGISKSTLYNIQAEVEGFLEQKEVTKAKPMLIVRKTIYESLSNLAGAHWYAERKSPTEFGNKIGLYDDGGAGALSDEKKAEIAMAMDNWADDDDEDDENDDDYENTGS